MRRNKKRMCVFPRRSKVVHVGKGRKEGVEKRRGSLLVDRGEGVGSPKKPAGDYGTKKEKKAFTSRTAGDFSSRIPKA